jgi:hypothetical protein
MSADPRDYKLDLSSAARAPITGGDTSSAGPGKGRPYLSVHFACCGAYQRIYRDPDGRQYQGRCPRCARPVRFEVGPGGTASRCFTVS